MALTIASDIDGVLADIGPELHQRVAANYGIPEDQVTKDKFLMHERFGIEFDDMERFLHEHCFNDPQFWLKAPGYVDNIMALEELAIKHNVVFITGRHNTIRPTTVQWFSEWTFFENPFILMEALHIKHKVMKHLGAHCLIEDRFQEAKTVAEQGYKSFLVRRDYNIVHETTYQNPNLIWIDSIQDIISYDLL